MNLAGIEYLTQKDLAFEWGVTVRTVRNERKRWRLLPAKFIGLMPLFTRDAVAKAESLRNAKRTRQLGIDARQR